MKTIRKKAAGDPIDGYIAGYPVDVQNRLKQIRSEVRQLIPEAEERLSYGMPAFFLHGNLVYFAAFAHHIGFYPGAAGIAAFTADIAGYKNAKGSVQFPHDRPLPLTLIRKIVKFRIRQNMEKAVAKKKPKRS